MLFRSCIVDLEKSLNYWQENSDRMIGKHKEIKIFFAPWNKAEKPIIDACKDLGLKFCNVKKGNWEDYYVKSFHWWSYEDTIGKQR